MLDADGAGSEPTIGAMILAAGRSSRMGTHKLLLPLGDQPIIAHVALAALHSTATPLVVVLGRDAEQVRAALPPGRIVTTVNAAYADGLAGSVRVGLDCLLAHEGAALAGVLILLGDQPLVTATLLGHILASACETPDAIIAASYGGARGNPVYFPRSLFDELAALSGDEGARPLLKRHPKRLRLVELGATEAALDVDDAADYERVLAYWRAQEAARES